MKLLYGIVVLSTLCSGISGQKTSPYQVLIRLYDNFKTNVDGINLCSGAIIHESYILTAAHCLFTHIVADSISRPYQPAQVYVVGGNFTNSNATTRHVEKIFIHEKYNVSSQQNDIALLKLDVPFQLKNSTLMQWIELDDKNGTRIENCFVAFQNRKNVTPAILEPDDMFPMDYWFCNKNALNPRKEDICAHYKFSDNRQCNTTAEQLSLNSDLGAPFICNNRATGILSQIIVPDSFTTSTSSCDQTQKTWAIYTKVSLYANWIYNIIGSNSPSSPIPPQIIPTYSQPPNQPSGLQPIGQPGGLQPPPLQPGQTVNPSQQHPPTKAPTGKSSASLTSSLNWQFTLITSIITILFIKLASK